MDSGFGADTNISAVTARVAFLENGVDGFGASSAKSLGSFIDQYQDELIGALLASNIITMVGFACYLLAGRCSRRKYAVVNDQAGVYARENLSV